MRKYFLCLVLSALGLLTGCAASLPSAIGGNCYNKALPMLLDSTDLKALFQDIAAELCVDPCPSGYMSKTKDARANASSCTNQDDTNRMTVLVTDFADLQSFLPNQSGILMGELMRGSLSKVCSYKIVQAEFGKYFKLSEYGLIVLTRNVREIKKDEYSQSEAIVGTYSYQNNNKIVIFVRKINTETGNISRMVTREVNYACAGGAVLGYNVK
jgi:hypothetical protein